MKSETKFKLKTFLYYLVVEPFTEKVTFPNTRTASWIVIALGFILKIELLLFIGLIVGLSSHLFYEYRSGKYMYWYRQRKYREQREALKKIREERKNGFQNPKI